MRNNVLAANVSMAKIAKSSSIENTPGGGISERV
jgi:hypothetical protein